MVQAHHSTPPSQFSTAYYSTIQLWPIVALYSLVFDSNQTRTKHGVIDEVNQTVIAFLNSSC